MAERLVRRAHRGRRVAVHMDDLVVCRDSRRWRAHKEREAERCVFDVVVEYGCRRNTVMANAGQLAVVSPRLARSSVSLAGWWPTIEYICARVSWMRTGRFSTFAASAVNSVCGQT